MGPIARAVMTLEKNKPGLGDFWRSSAPDAYRRFETCELRELADSWTMSSKVRRNILLSNETGICR